MFLESEREKRFFNQVIVYLIRVWLYSEELSWCNSGSLMCLLWYKSQDLLSPSLLGERKGRSEQGIEEGKPCIHFSLVQCRNSEYVPGLQRCCSKGCCGKRDLFFHLYYVDEWVNYFSVWEKLAWCYKSRSTMALSLGGLMFYAV